MLISIHPKLPMRNKQRTKDYYVEQLGFQYYANSDYEDYLILKKDEVEIHFFLFKEFDPATNYGQVYIRVKPLQAKPWGQKEFALLDPDHNLLTFGEAV
jgi:catechol 2,3-dioxygenase-like lactoylglutathione lyase family enzyme